MSLFRRRDAGKGGTPFEWLVVGLGNPGKQYAGSRHNVGEQVVTLLAGRHGTKLRSGRDNALVGESRVGDHRVVLAFPLTYMNLSGQAVRALARRYRIEAPERMIIVHDELDLEPTLVRVKHGGGLAGHNGLRSIESHLGTRDFIRVRIGVGKPPSKEQGTGHVLSKLSAREKEGFGVAIEQAADAVEKIVTAGPDAAMREYNGRKLTPNE